MHKSANSSIYVSKVSNLGYLKVSNLDCILDASQADVTKSIMTKLQRTGIQICMSSLPILSVQQYQGAYYSFEIM